MIFHNPRKKIKELKLHIENTSIDRIQDFNFLGLTVNESLDWKSHIDKISNKISRSIGILNRLKHFLPLEIKKMLYNSLILPHINFCVLAWGYNCSRIVKLQKKAVRIVSLSKYNAHSEPILKSLKLLKVTDILKLQLLKLYFKFQNNMLPDYLQTLPFKTNRSLHDHSTRIHDYVHTNRPEHEFARKCIRYSIPMIINNTPVEIIEKIHTHSLQGYAQYIKTKILLSYEENCTIIDCYVCSNT
jgi:hypothetical protein